jgi:hypothetical protein
MGSAGPLGYGKELEFCAKSNGKPLECSVGSHHWTDPK